MLLNSGRVCKRPDLSNPSPRGVCVWGICMYNGVRASLGEGAKSETNRKSISPQAILY
jgi:hypothetical protein